MATGPEMMLKMLGIDPNMLNSMAVEVRDKIFAAAEAMADIKRQNEELHRKMDFSLQLGVASYNQLRKVSGQMDLVLDLPIEEIGLIGLKGEEFRRELLKIADESTQRMIELRAAATAQVIEMQAAIGEPIDTFANDPKPYQSSEGRVVEDAMLMAKN